MRYVLTASVDLWVCACVCAYVACVLAQERVLLGALALTDELKPSAAPTVASLTSAGVEVRPTVALSHKGGLGL